MKRPLGKPGKVHDKMKILKSEDLPAMSTVGPRGLGLYIIQSSGVKVRFRVQ